MRTAANPDPGAELGFSCEFSHANIICVIERGIAPATEQVAVADREAFFHVVSSSNTSTFVTPAPSPQLRGVDLAFLPATDSAQAQSITAALTGSHYENFSVVSLLLPARLRQDFCNIYAFCRVADDLGDEIPDTAEALKQLARFRADLNACYEGRAQTVVFVALKQTIDRHQIPIEPFADLISAFEQDQTVKRYETFDQLVDYCRRSADPVGRLVLYVSGYRDAQRQRLSDFTCTALQLANFWQDVKRDLADLNRIYIPAESMRRFGVTEEQLRAGQVNDAYREMIKFEVDRTSAMFDEGEQLLPMLERSVRRHVALFGMGGRAVLEEIRRANYDTLSRRPALSKWTKGRLVARALASHLLGGFARGAAL